MVILFFGRPKLQGSVQGTVVYSDTFASLAQIAPFVEQFAQGYWDCTIDDPNSHVRIVVGTSNNRYEVRNNFGTIIGYDDNVTAEHGSARGQPLKDVDQWVIDNNLIARVDVVGGSDMELAWNTSTRTIAWADAYDSAVFGFNLWLYDFGDCGGCSYTDSLGRRFGWGASFSDGFSSWAWTQEQVYHVSWGLAKAWPLPQIYRRDGVMAQQWYDMSLYAFQNHGASMAVRGPLTQMQACLQDRATSPTACIYLPDPKQSTDNPPDQGWQQLWGELNKDPRTSVILRFLTDIKKDV